MALLAPAFASVEHNIIESDIGQGRCKYYIAMGLECMDEHIGAATSHLDHL